MRWRSALVSAVVLLLFLGALGTGLAWSMSPDAQDRAGNVITQGTPRQGSTLSGEWVALKPEVPPTQVADAVVPAVALFSSPNVPLPGWSLVANPTWEHLPLVFEVLQDAGPWLQVKVSMRPNGAAAWIKASDVALRTVPNRVTVSLSAHRVTVTRGDAVLLDENAVIGTPDSPTPVGSFFVDGIVNTNDPTGAYGPLQVSVSGFSDTYTEFVGGNGQIAIHGTNRPDLLGQAASHGCVRIQNDAVTRLSLLAPTGTPVDIVA